MHKPIAALFIAAFLLSNCSTRANPVNWFGNSRNAPAEAQDAATVNPLIPKSTRRSRRNEPVPYQGAPIDSVTALKLERVPGGLIVRADGVARMQGGYEAALTLENEEVLPVDGVLTFRMEIRLPATQRPIGDARTREITVARRLTNQD
ncbi:MAG: hypothetical protein KC451_16250, partial [Amylibacter sp.]|nr:hypothetical protein [Amylibacter sp.]